VVFAGDNGPEEVLLWRGTPGYWEGSYFAGGEGNPLGLPPSRSDLSRAPLSGCPAWELVGAWEHLCGYDLQAGARRSCQESWAGS
jgi:hypothetical protein